MKDKTFEPRDVGRFIPKTKEEKEWLKEMRKHKSSKEKLRERALKTKW